MSQRSLFFLGRNLATVLIKASGFRRLAKRILRSQRRLAIYNVRRLWNCARLKGTTRNVSLLVRAIWLNQLLMESMNRGRQWLDSKRKTVSATYWSACIS
jgi:hypothetical protein